MKSIIQEVQQELTEVINDTRTQEQLFNDIARQRLVKIYNNENEEFNRLIDKLEVSIDYNEVSQVKKCVTKILSLLSKNRKVLYKTLRRI